MCFKNLPIEFDEQGRARLRTDVADPYSYRATTAVADQQERVRELLARNGHIKDVSIDPVTRVAGALAFHAVVDLASRKVEDAHAVATLFRGYEIILRGRDPRDAIFISSRACGVCGGVHSNAAAEAIEMAFGVAPPPLGIVMRNLGQSAEFLYDHPLHLFLLAGPDYSEAVVKSAEPRIWALAEQALAPNQVVHGYRTIAEMMHDLNPLTGKLYLEALEITRRAREATVLAWGKYPHPQTIVPGGISVTVTLQTLNEYQTRLFELLDHSKKMALLWDDLFNFFYQAEPQYLQVGRRPKNLIELGIWDHHEAYDATYANAGAWGEKRWATPGVILEDRGLVTTDLHLINAGLEEFVEHSYYETWDDTPPRYPTDPLGNPLSPYHPWNKDTRPKPTGRSWREKYTWDTAPRWDRQVVEAGAYARIWTTTAANKLPENPYIQTDGRTIRLAVPRGRLPAMTLEWTVPEANNAIERNRARAFSQPYTALVALANLEIAFDLLKRGETEVARPYTVPKDHRIGVGFWGAGRGYLAHHLTMDGGAITNYQICTPSTLNASPRDPWGQPGPYEEAVLNTPILEEFSSPDEYKGIDILRTIRSFDPCMPCTTHVYAGQQTIVREINTCACILEDAETPVGVG
jgi:hydrogenase large subunit